MTTTVTYQREVSVVQDRVHVQGTTRAACGTEPTGVVMRTVSAAQTCGKYSSLSPIQRTARLVISDLYHVTYCLTSEFSFVYGS